MLKISVCFIISWVSLCACLTLERPAQKRFKSNDYTAADDLMALPLPTPKGLLADKGYDGDRFRENLLMRGILSVIPPRSNRKIPEHPEYRCYNDRSRVERMLAKLKQHRLKQHRRIANC
ncbi:MAG: transposase [Sphingorhabdus sp.]|uniref:transposase n=1 Tax=Sphingorhabdus sp. TaxID=1902408 RepID=UPI0025D5F5A1|nr:transposase [Sphingorhabdus sp.]MCO4090640.1 transposase [Sphingorhabdus sp.]